MGEEGNFKEWSVKEFLVYFVRKLSRMAVGKSTENVWTETSMPADWDSTQLGKWKNPTSSPKDDKALLQKKFEYFKVKLSSSECPQSLAIEIELFESGKLKELNYCKLAEEAENKIIEVTKSGAIGMCCDSMPYLKVRKQKLRSACETYIQKFDENKAPMSSSVSPLKRSRKALEKVPNKKLKSKIDIEQSMSSTQLEHTIKKYQPILPKVTFVTNSNIQDSVRAQLQNDAMSLQCKNTPQTKSQMVEHSGHQGLIVGAVLGQTSFLSSQQPVEEKVKSISSLYQTEQIENRILNHLMYREPEEARSNTNTEHKSDMAVFVKKRKKSQILQAKNNKICGKCEKVKSVSSLCRTEQIKNRISNHLFCPEPREPKSNANTAHKSDIAIFCEQFAIHFPKNQMCKSPPENICSDQIISDLSEKPDVNKHIDWSVDSGLGNNCQSLHSVSDQSVLSDLDPKFNLNSSDEPDEISFNNAEFMALLDSIFPDDINYELRCETPQFNIQSQPF